MVDFKIDMELVGEFDKDEEYILGVDEAGRGPVLGPLVYSVFICPNDKEKNLREFGVRDSKVLTPQNRDAILTKLRNNFGYGWCSRAISPQEISNSMLQQKINLNELSFNTVYSLLDKVLKDLKLKVKRIFVDTLGKPEKYQAKLEDRYSGIKFTVCSKADSIYPVVGAASIVAKTTRDSSLKNFPLPSNISREYGSGYPGDPLTIRWLDANAHPVHGFPDIVRFSWSSAEKVLERKGFKAVFRKERGSNFRGMMRLASMTMK